jgi:hypothetical protein
MKHRPWAPPVAEPRPGPPQPADARSSAAAAKTEVYRAWSPPVERSVSPAAVSPQQQLTVCMHASSTFPQEAAPCAVAWSACLEQRRAAHGAVCACMPPQQLSLRDLCTVSLSACPE